MSKKAKVIFYGGADAVTGSNFMFETEDGHKILIDCGLTQGNEELEKRNWERFIYDPSEVEVLVVTHAHMDHIGLIGKLVAEGFNGEIISTSATKELSKVMLADGLRIMKERARRNEIEPLWTEQDLEKAFSKWKTREYHETGEIIDGVGLEYLDAGHILGSAMAKISYGTSVITFSGDLGNSPSPLLQDTEDVEGSDYLVMEAVYGDRDHADRSERQQILKGIIERAIDRNGPIIIPAFSLERTQMLLYEINELVESGSLPTIPVFLDSPLAIRVLDVYENNTHYFNDKARDDIKGGDDIFRFPGLKISRTKEDSKSIDDTPNPKIIIAGSGMSHAGRVLFHEKKYLSQPETTVIFVGYQSPGTLGRQIIEGNKRVRIMGKYIKVRASVDTLLSYSSHKDSQNLEKFARYASQSGLKEVAVVLSEPGVAIKFSHRLTENDDFGAKVKLPEHREFWEIEM